MHRTRDPLQKENFGEGTRQIWLGILLGCVGVVLLADVFTDIDPLVYVTAIGTMGTTFIVKAGADSKLKIHAAEKQLEYRYEDTTTKRNRTTGNPDSEQCASR